MQVWQLMNQGGLTRRPAEVWNGDEQAFSWLSKATRWLFQEATGVAIIYSLIRPPELLAQDITDRCGPAADVVRTAALFLFSNRDEVLDELSLSWYGALNEGWRNRFHSALIHTTIVCNDGGNRCPADVLGMHGRAGVRICYWNHAGYGMNLCGLIATIAHEYGHAAGFPVMAGHNQDLWAEDPVISVGVSASKVCQRHLIQGSFEGGVLPRYKASCRGPFRLDCSWQLVDH